MNCRNDFMNPSNHTPANGTRTIRRTLLPLAIVAGCLLSASPALASISVSQVGAINVVPAKNADTGTDAYDTQSVDAIITEGGAGELAATDQIIIYAPSGFSFNTAATITTTEANSLDIGDPVITTGTMTYTVATPSSGGAGTATIAGIQLQADNCTAARTNVPTPPILVSSNIVAGNSSPAVGLVLANVTITPASPSALKISDPIGTQEAGIPFSVTASSVDACNNVVAVSADTAIALSKTAGSGTLGGTTTGTIASGSSSTTINNVTLDTATTGVELTATRTSGDVLSADASAAFEVEEAGAQAMISSPASGATLTSSSVTFSWSAATGASGYWLRIGSTAGAKDIYDASVGSALFKEVSGLPRDGSTIYVRLYSNIDGAWPYRDHTYTTCTNCLQTTGASAVMTSPADTAFLSGASQTFTWSEGSAATGYWLRIGSTQGGKDIYDASTGEQTSAQVDGLPTDGSTIYVRLFSNVGGVWDYSDYTYTASGAPTITSAPGLTIDPAKNATTGSDGFDTAGNIVITESGAGVWQVGDTFTLAAPAGYLFNTAAANVTATGTNNLDMGGGAGLAATAGTDTGATISETEIVFTVAGVSSGGAGVLTIANVPLQAISCDSAVYGDAPDIIVTKTGAGAMTAVAADVTVGNGAISTFEIVEPIGEKVVDATFSVAVKTADICGNAVAVSGDTVVALTSTGEATSQTGSLSGTTIASGSSSTTITGIVLDTVVDAAKLTVAKSSGPDTIASDESEAFAVVDSDGQAAITSPADGSTLAATSQTFQWNAADGASSYWLRIGSTPNGKDYYDADCGNVTQMAVGGLPGDGSTVYVRLYTNIDGAWPYLDFTYTTCSNCGGSSGPQSEMSSPSDGAFLAAATQTFTWSEVSNATGYWLRVGTGAVNAKNILDLDMGTNTSYQVTGLPTDGSTVYVRLFTEISGNWLYNDYTYTASGAAAIDAVGAMDVSADKNADSGTGTYDTLDANPAFSESSAGDFALGATITITPPDGFSINAAQAVTATIAPADATGIDLGAGAGTAATTASTGASISASQVQFTVAAASTAASTITITGLQLQADDCDAATAGDVGDVIVEISGANGYRAVLVDVTVAAGAAAAYKITEPISGVVAENPFSMEVSLLDACGNTTTANGDNAFSVSAGGAGGLAVLSDTMTVSEKQGTVANGTSSTTLTALQLDTAWSGVTLTVTPMSGELFQASAVTSSPFDVAAYEGQAAISSPTPGSTISGAGDVTFTWNAAAGATAYWLKIGTTLGGNDVLSENVATATTKTIAAADLPNTDSTWYVRLYSLIDGDWLELTYTYTFDAP